MVRNEVPSVQHVQGNFARTDLLPEILERVHLEMAQLLLFLVQTSLSE